MRKGRLGCLLLYSALPAHLHISYSTDVMKIEGRKCQRCPLVMLYQYLAQHQAIGISYVMFKDQTAELFVQTI